MSRNRFLDLAKGILEDIRAGDSSGRPHNSGRLQRPPAACTGTGWSRGDTAAASSNGLATREEAGLLEIHNSGWPKTDVRGRHSSSGGLR